MMNRSAWRIGTPTPRAGAISHAANETEAETITNQ